MGAFPNKIIPPQSPAAGSCNDPGFVYSLVKTIGDVAVPIALSFPPLRIINEAFVPIFP